MRDGLERAWVDTYFIDKSSSAELSEAINSMFGRYRNSKVCYAYLSDVESCIKREFFEHDPQRRPRNLEESRWFTRGWTLQELIAPREVHFFCKVWNFLGHRHTLGHHIASIAGILSALFHGSKELNSFSVAQRMSWASKRQTTREEDTAYCLRGMFDIQMPLLYGEGTKAFIRLQEEIIKQIDDQSLFAWAKSDLEHPEIWSIRGVLADSPADFAARGAIEVQHEEVGEPSTLTKKGLHIHAPLLPLEFPHMTRFHNYGIGNAYSRRGMDPRLFQMVLNCTNKKHWRGRRVVLWVLVLRTDNWHCNGLDGQAFARIITPRILGLPSEAQGRKLTDLTEEFHHIYLTTKPQIHQPFVNGDIHFHGVPIIFEKGHDKELSEPLWDEGWCLVSNESSYLVGHNYDLSGVADHQARRWLPASQPFRRHFGDYSTFCQRSVGPVSAGLWKKELLNIGLCQMHLLLLVIPCGQNTQHLFAAQ